MFLGEMDNISDDVYNQALAIVVDSGDEYSYEVDYWSVGVCLYEFVYGEVPFGHDASEVIEIYSSIINE